MNPLICQTDDAPPVKHSENVYIKNDGACMYVHAFLLFKNKSYHNMSLVSLVITQASSNITMAACTKQNKKQRQNSDEG